MSEPDCGEIYARYRDKVFGFVRSKIFNQTEAEDIVQSVFLKVFRNIGKYDKNKSSLSTWIYTITRNTVYDYLKKRRDYTELDLIENTVRSEDETDKAILSEETLEELARALKKLSQTERDVIILTYYHSKKKTEVAEILGITYGQLRYLHDKALSRLSELM